MEPTVLEQTFAGKRDTLLAELNKLTKERDVISAENKAVADSTLSLKTYELELQQELQQLKENIRNSKAEITSLKKELTTNVDSLHTISSRLENEISFKKGILAQLTESVDKFTAAVANSLEVSNNINKSIPKVLSTIEQASAAVQEKVNIFTNTAEHFVNDIMSIERQQNQQRATLNEKELQLNNRELALNVIAEQNVLPQ